MGKKIFVVILAFLLGAAGFCKSVSFQIVQHNDNLSEVCSSALLIEDEILSNFFGAGHIVSNMPSVMSSSSTQDKNFWNQGYKEALEGFFDNFIQINLYFDEKKAISPSELAINHIEKVTWKVVSVDTGKTLDEGSRKVTASASSNKEKDIRKFADELAVYLQKTLKK